ncbi:hypothetical protein HanRHA438_Chr01g0017321 [Helianthus annuus]|uniref:Uncharacterized protein n=1 Tax=Helianthus annuus TaxID=4232 RepID=A0A9K3JUK3_HELAN|nr:hypothetical protein HanXRQr2_Chr01g0016901 [Helianthus annuus]KAJ0947628.1 hypothetical protein HanRHA438_Chr01g0017321 [Helianthus annuus]KAJ0956568.1 hypothetical protein HanPSC8_Chr01g0016331 [Helianthus annuus]
MREKKIFKKKSFLVVFQSFIKAKKKREKERYFCLKLIFPIWKEPEREKTK